MNRNHVIDALMRSALTVIRLSLEEAIAAREHAIERGDIEGASLLAADAAVLEVTLHALRNYKGEWVPENDS